MANEKDTVDWTNADTYTLAYFIRHGTEDDKCGAMEAWRQQMGKPFPYHPSYENDTYPEGD